MLFLNIMKSGNIAKVDWVFWVQIEKREGFYKKFWKSRGSNCIDIQIYNYRISIGLPWHPQVLEKANENYPLEGIDHFHRVNEQNRLGIKRHGRFRFIKN